MLGHAEGTALSTSATLAEGPAAGSESCVTGTVPGPAYAGLALVLTER